MRICEAFKRAGAWGALLLLLPLALLLLLPLALFRASVRGLPPTPRTHAHGAKLEAEAAKAESERIRVQSAGELATLPGDPAGVADRFRIEHEKRRSDASH